MDTEPQAIAQPFLLRRLLDIAQRDREADVFAGERVPRFEARRVIDGAVRRLRVRLSPLKAGGQVVGASAVVRAAAVGAYG